MPESRPRSTAAHDRWQPHRSQVPAACAVGDVVSGTVMYLAESGAYIDVNGVNGFIHISELSWRHVDHPAEVVSIGDTVETRVLDIDRDRQRISLGLKQMQQDPWQRVCETYDVGDKLDVTVTEVLAFGVYVEIMEGIQALVHAAEISDDVIADLRDVLRVGDHVTVEVLELDEPYRRIRLSIRQT